MNEGSRPTGGCGQPPVSKPRLLDRVRGEVRLRHMSLRIEKAYVQWIRRFVIFYGKRHPGELVPDAITSFLNHLAVERSVSAATQNQALNAMLLLYQRVLGRSIPELAGLVRARKPRHLPVVLTPAEVHAMLAELEGRNRRVAQLLYGSGLRLLEALRLRVKDSSFERREVVVRRGNARSAGRLEGRESWDRRAATRSATASRRICWSAAPTSVRCRSCSATGAWPPR